MKPHTEECRARIIQAMSEDEGLSSRVRNASERMGLAQSEKERRLQLAGTCSSPSADPPTGSSATVTTANGACAYSDGSKESRTIYNGPETIGSPFGPAGVDQ